MKITHYFFAGFCLLHSLGARAQISDCNYAFFKVLSPVTVIRDRPATFDDRQLLASAVRSTRPAAHATPAQLWAGAQPQAHNEVSATFAITSDAEMVYAVTVPPVWALYAPAVNGGGHDAMVRLYLSIPPIASAQNGPGIQAFALQAMMKMGGQLPRLHIQSDVPVVVNYN